MMHSGTDGDEQPTSKCTRTTVFPGLIDQRPVRFAEAALALVTLTVMAIGVPVVATLGNGPTFFVAHRAPTSEIITVLFAVLAGPALITVLILSLAWAVPSNNVRSAAALALIASFSGFLVLQQVSRVMGSAAHMAILASASGILAGIAYLRWSTVRRGLRELAFGTLVIPVWFIFISPASGLFGFGVSQPEAVRRVENPIPVTIVVFDEFHTAAILDRNGDVDVERFPNFGTMATNGTWYPRAVSQSFSTIQALPSLVSGTVPLNFQNRAPTWREFPDTIFSALAPHYDIRALESYVFLCPPVACTTNEPTRAPESILGDLKVVLKHSVYPSNMRVGLQPLEDRWSGFDQGGKRELDATLSAPATMNSNYGGVFEVLSSVGRRPKNQFNFFHILVPHAPHDRVHDGRLHTRGWQIPGREGDDFVGEAPLIESAYHLYLHQVGLADQILGDIIDTLKNEGIWDESLVIVVADHGVAHTENLGRRNPSPNAENWQEIYRVPFFAKFPFGEGQGAMDSSIVTLADVVPTLADVLGFALPFDVEGSSIRSSEVKERVSIEIDVGRREMVRIPDRDLANLRRLPWQVDRFGDSTALSELTRQDGLNAILIGRPVAAYRVEDSTSQVVVETLGDVFPVRIRGHLAPSAEELPITGVAAAIDGEIVATAVPSPWSGHEQYWELMLPPARLEKNWSPIVLLGVRLCAHSLEICELVPTGQDIGVDFQPVTLPGGKQYFQVGSATVGLTETFGHIDSVTVGEHTVTLYGWAAHSVDLSAPSALAVLASRQPIASQIQWYERADISNWLLDEFGRNTTSIEPKYGWSATIPRETFEQAGSRLQFVALYRDSSAGIVSEASESVRVALRGDWMSR